MSKSASDKFRDLTELIKYRVMYDLNVAEQCIVKKYDSGKNTADVTTAIKDKDGIDDTITINGCPVLTSVLIQFDKVTNKPIYSPLIKGEKVMVVFDNRDIDNFTPDKNSTYQKNSSRMHSVNDAVVIGRFKVVQE